VRGASSAGKRYEERHVKTPGCVRFPRTCLSAAHDPSPRPYSEGTEIAPDTICVRSSSTFVWIASGIIALFLSS